MKEVRKLPPSQRIRWAIGTLDAIRDNSHVAEVLPVLSDTAADVFAKESAVSQAVLWAAVAGFGVGSLVTYWLCR